MANHENHENHENPIPKQFSKRLQIWYFSFWTWRFLHYATGIAAITLSIVVSSVPFDESSHWKTGLSVAAAICTGMITFLKPAVNSKAYISAWRVLDAECGPYQKQPSNEMYDNLVAAQSKGEEIIAQTD